MSVPTELVVCENLERETREVLEKNHLNVVLRTVAPICVMAKEQPPKNRCVVLECHLFESSKLCSGPGNSEVCNACFGKLVNRAVVEDLLRKRCWLTSPGRLLNWRETIGELGENQTSTREYFRKSISEIVLLDTGVDLKSEKRLQEFAEYVDRSYRILPVGLDFLELHIKQAIFEQNLKEGGGNGLNKTKADENQQQIAFLKAELAKVNRELQGVLFIASHEFRSPLLNIQGFSKRLGMASMELTKMVADTALSAEVHEKGKAAEEQINRSLQFISSSILKMEMLIEGLLKLSRLGRAQLRQVHLEMNQIVAHCVQSLQFQIQSSGGRVVVDALPNCVGDAMLIEQVFSNLLDNAIKYRDATRALAIHVTGKRDGNMVVYEVSDTGIGIPRDQLERIWDLFYRLDPEGPVKGDGIGLKLVWQIVERHDGKAWCESDVGKGSRFFISLPVILESGSPAVYLKNETRFAQV